MARKMETRIPSNVDPTDTSEEFICVDIPHVPYLRLKISKSDTDPLSLPNADPLPEPRRSILEGTQEFYQCRTCFRTFLQEKSLEEHVQVRATMSYFPCQVCHRVFDSAISVDRHYYIMHCNKRGKDAVCATYKMKPRRVETRTNPVRQCEQIRATCPICQVESSSSEWMDAHLARHVQATRYNPKDLLTQCDLGGLDTPLICRICDVNLYTVSAYHAHRCSMVQHVSGKAEGQGGVLPSPRRFSMNDI